MIGKKTKRVAISLITNSEDKMLMGRRNDTDKWTQCAGHLEKGECPFLGMARELKESKKLIALIFLRKTSAK